MPSQTILIVEDEQDIVDLIAYNLKREGYTVESEFTTLVSSAAADGCVVGVLWRP